MSRQHSRENTGFKQGVSAEKCTRNNFLAVLESNKEIEEKEETRRRRESKKYPSITELMKAHKK